MNDSNRMAAEAYYLLLYSPETDRAISEHLSDDYIEHQYTAEFSKDGLRSYVSQRLKDHPDHKVVIHHVLGEGDFIFLFVEEKLGGGLDVARAELFRFKEGKIVEHWGAHVVDEKNRKNNNGTFDGSQVNRNVDYARKYVTQFEALDLRGFNEQEIEAFTESRPPNYMQHSPKGADGLSGLANLLAKMKADGIKMTMSPKRTIVDGDFIMSHRFYNTVPPHPLCNCINTFDMFRIDANGKAVEHWDVMEDVPSPELLDRIF